MFHATKFTKKIIRFKVFRVDYVKYFVGLLVTVEIKNWRLRRNSTVITRSQRSNRAHFDLAIGPRLIGAEHSSNRLLILDF